MTRFEYFNEHKTYTRLLAKYETREFLEVTVDRFGDVVTYRVYGDNENNYKIYER